MSNETEVMCKEWTYRMNLKEWMHQATLGDIADWLDGTAWNIERKESWVGIMEPGSHHNLLHGHPARKLGEAELSGIFRCAEIARLFESAADTLGVPDASK
jgi:hypothetical protein